jgi:hypothetical protein
MHLTDFNRVFHSAVTQYMLFSAAHETFSKTDHISGCKTSLRKYKKTGKTPRSLSKYSGIKLGLNGKRNYRKYSNTWRLNNTLLKDQMVTEEKRRKSFTRI